MTFPQRYAYVIAIEGIDTLFSNASESAVLAAWTGTDWSSVTRGIFVECDQEQSAHPWEPFQRAGTLTLSTADDDIGVIFHRSSGGAESELVTGIDRDDTSVVVKDTSAFASSGDIHIGNECIGFSSKTGTTFTISQRGKYHPFGTAASGSDPTHFAHNHRVDVVDYAPPLAPKVSQYPREHIGRWVGLWVHGYESDGTLQTKDNAQLLFAGRIAEIRDNPETLCTEIVADHMLTSLREQTLGRDFFSGEVSDGIYIPSGVTFGMADHNGTSARTANALTVVTSGAAGANQMNAGFYSSTALFAKLSAWWAAELAATRLWGTYTIAQAPTNSTPDSIRTKVYWRIPGSGTVLWGFSLPKAVSIFLGFNGDPATDALGTDTLSASGTSGSTHHFYKDNIPMRSWVSTGLSVIHLQLENLSGAFQDQYDTLPASIKPSTNQSLSWGVFSFDDQTLVRAAYTDNGDGTADLEQVHPILFDPHINAIEALTTFCKRIDDYSPTKIKQVFLFEMPTADFVNQVVYSSGTTSYSHADYDVLPYGCGIGYPGSLFGDAWETSVANMPGADKSIAVILDKPTKISTLLGSDFVLRHVFPIWKSGGLRMATWQTPSSSLAVASLTSANKSEPYHPGSEMPNHRTATLLSDRWAKDAIKIRYNRSLVGNNDDEYRSTINVEDRTAIDDTGDRGEPFTIECRNTFDEFSQTGAGIEDLVPNAFIPAVTLFTKPMRTLRRSLAYTLWDLTPGDIVTVTDGFARDPNTGLRSLTSRPAIVIGVKIALPGHTAQPGPPAPRDSVGEVDLMLTASDRFYAYSPSAVIDASENSGGFSAGYDSGGPQLRCVAHTYSESSETADAARFAAGDSIRIIEIDPSNPASPTTWTRVIDDVSGNDITLTSTLSAPAWDPAKEYRIIPDTYSAVQSSQTSTAFQADDADGLIENVAQANTFGLVTSTIAATASAHTDLPERHSDTTFGDGKPYDVGSVVGFARLVDNLIDHKTAISCPMLGSTASNSTYSTGAGFRVVSITPMFLSSALLSNSVTRRVKVAPWLRSSDGTATSVRVSLCATPPTDATLNDIVIPTPSDSATFSTSSTTWATGTATTLSCGVKNASGIVWVVIECNYKGETRGLAYCVEQERTVF